MKLLTLFTFLIAVGRLSAAAPAQSTTAPGASVVLAGYCPNEDGGVTFFFDIRKEAKTYRFVDGYYSKDSAGYADINEGFDIPGGYVKLTSVAGMFVTADGIAKEAGKYLCEPLGGSTYHVILGRFSVGIRLPREVIEAYRKNLKIESGEMTATFRIPLFELVDSGTSFTATSEVQTPKVVIGFRQDGGFEVKEPLMPEWIARELKKKPNKMPVPMAGLHPAMAHH